MDNSIQASVIICAYTLERWGDLKAAIASVQQQEIPAGEIILVIDHNPMLMKMAEIQFPDILVVENLGRRGLSGARNTGVELASQEVVVFMDEDAVAEPNWLVELLNAYQDEQTIGVGGEVRPNWLGKQPVWFPREFNWVVGCSWTGGPDTLSQVRNMIGCNMSFRKEVYHTSGGFRDSLGRLGMNSIVSCEETEFCIRANR
jgi:glucosyl-dolichyl phosphate glucuronosyltransferase